MSLVNVTSVEVGQNPAPVLSGFNFHVVFECLDRLEADLEWKFIYVGSSEDKGLDQELDCVVMGPVNRGTLKFSFETEAPDFSMIPPDDVLGFTIILLTGSYRDEEFIRIGWYVHNLYLDPALEEEPPLTPQFDKMHRMILTDAPRVTRFKISWDNPSAVPKPSFEIQDTSGGVQLLNAAEIESAAELKNQQQVVGIQNNFMSANGVVPTHASLQSSSSVVHTYPNHVAGPGGDSMFANPEWQRPPPSMVVAEDVEMMS